MGICQGPECDRETERRYCDAHWKQVQRGGPLTPLAQPTSPLEALILAASDLAEVDAEDDAEFRRAKERAEAASLRLARALGWRPPVPRKPSPCCCHVIQLALPLKTRRPRAVHGRAYPVT